MSARFARITAELNDGKSKVGTESNVSLPESWTPIDLDRVGLLEEANQMKKSPTKLKMGPFLVEMAASMAPMGGPKMEPLVEILLDGTGQENLTRSTMGLVLTGWNNLLNNVANLKNKMDSQNGGERKFREASITLSEIQGVINLSDGKIQLLLAWIGDILNKEDQSITLWEAVELIHTEIETATALLLMGQKEVSSQGSQIEATEANMEILSQNYKLLSTSYQKHIKQIYVLITALEKKLNENKSSSINEFDFLPSDGDASASLSLQELQEKVDHLTSATNDQ
jgi:hypothetical protein